MQKRNRKLMKTIIISTIAMVLLLLLMLSKGITKLQNKNKLNIAESIDNKETTVEVNIPRLSAGMIPVKLVGESWEITSKEDKDWYNYVEGKPAYIMLNDGVYQSEIQANMINKKLAKDNIGVKVQESELGTIFMWIPRFEINSKTSEIKYIKGIKKAEEGFTLPDLFVYKQVETTKPNYELTGVWVEKNIDTDYSSKVTQMNKEESVYGFIANAKAAQIRTVEITILKRIAGNKSYSNSLIEPANTNRLTIKVINGKEQDPIKASGKYNKETGKIEVQVTYSQYKIDKIILQGLTELKFKKKNGITTADSTGIALEDGKTYKVEIIDNKQNTRELEINVLFPIYVTLYTDGTLAFDNRKTTIEGKNVDSEYGDVSEKKYNYNTIPWYSKEITTVDFVNEIRPISTKYWFYGCNKLTTINNIENLNTKNVTDMSSMFMKCSGLNNIDLSNFNTSNVTNMQDMFNSCSGLSSIDVSSFNTSNVINMYRMFGGCGGLTSIDLSNFDTSSVTNMGAMFSGCGGLTSIDVSNFDTSSVTNMGAMFSGCSSLSSIDVSNFDTSSVTNMGAMFNECSSLSSIDVSNFNTSNVTNMSGMFWDCNGLSSIDLSSFNTNNVTNMSMMFNECSSLSSINLRSFDTSNVTDMMQMFENCSSLTNLDLSNFNTSNVTNMSMMFNECSSLSSINLRSFDTSNVTDMMQMFENCSSLTNLDLSNFNTNNVTNMQRMFYSCSKLTTIYVGEHWKLASNRGDMFRYCGTNRVTKK